MFAKATLKDRLYSDDYDEVLLYQGEELIVLGRIESDIFGSGLGYVVYALRNHESYSLDSELIRFTEHAELKTLNER